MVIDVFVTLFVMVFMLTMVIQILSLVKLINFLAEKKSSRMMFKSLLVVLTLIYISDVFEQMIYYWGIPAYIMTLKQPNDTREHCTDVVPPFLQGIMEASFSINIYSDAIWLAIFSFFMVALKVNVPGCGGSKDTCDEDLHRQLTPKFNPKRLSLLSEHNSNNQIG